MWYNREKRYFQINGAELTNWRFIWKDNIDPLPHTIHKNKLQIVDLNVKNKGSRS